MVPPLFVWCPIFGEQARSFGLLFLFGPLILFCFIWASIALSSVCAFFFVFCFLFFKGKRTRLAPRKGGTVTATRIFSCRPVVPHHRERRGGLGLVSFLYMPISLSSFFVSFHFSSFLSVLLFSPFDESAVNEGRLCLHAMSSCENEPLRETSLYFFFFFSCCFAIRRYRARVSSGLCRDRSSLFSSFLFFFLDVAVFVLQGTSGGK